MGILPKYALNLALGAEMRVNRHLCGLTSLVVETGSVVLSRDVREETPLRLDKGKVPGIM